ncbi:MGMT family protein [uncultured Friedmanniella sp.]|uniref:MGMT family protein n=1 Tax=uncultured Friedmanniella sp. TaxID=335381 RepID=UPI0035CA9751
MTPSVPEPEDAEAYVEAVLRVVESLPAGRVATYGDIARAVGRGGPRQVGTVMSRFGAAVPWWRVVRADGQPARGHEARALDLLRSEGTPVAGSHVVLSEARCPLPEQAAGGASPHADENYRAGFTSEPCM